MITRRTPQPARSGAPRSLPLLAFGLAVLSLALPWRNSSLEFGLASAWVPGYCHISYDGYSYCDPGYIAYGTSTTIGGPVPGSAGPIRVIAVLVALALVFGWRRRSQFAARLGLAIGAFGLVIGGFSATSGRLVWVLALGVTALLLDRSGLLRRSSTSHRSGARSGSAGPLGPLERVEPI